MKCPVCYSCSLFYGDYQPYTDYGVHVYDCPSCKTRFVERDPAIHEKLHSHPSSYSSHIAMEQQVFAYFAKKDLVGMRQLLSKAPANKFVIDAIEKEVGAMNILEIGCSRGYLTAYFIALGKQILGVDVSTTAITAATLSFGDHFAVAGSDQIVQRAPYDAIYHVGTIGCVEAPTKMTVDLLELLKPGGVLVFNAPNKCSASLSGRTWLGTPPPDLCRLFIPEYWRTNFSDIAEAKVAVLMASRAESGSYRRAATSERTPSVALFGPPAPRRVAFIQRVKDRFINYVYSLQGRLLPHEYGIHVLLRRR